MQRLEYIWIDADDNLRSKTMVKPEPIEGDAPAGYPVWNYDGSSTGQATGGDSEVLIRPVAIFNDPFRDGAQDKLVLCETCLYTEEKGVLRAHPTNRRAKAAEVFSTVAVAEEVPWFGIEQEFTLKYNDRNVVEPLDNRPLGFPNGGYTRPQGPFYCSVGAGNNYGRTVVEAMLDACIEAGLHVSGTNAEVMCGQHEIQIGVCEGIAMGDELWVARYIMHRVAEEHNVIVDLHPKPIRAGEFNGSGCHTNYSTASTRDNGGMSVINDHMERLSNTHAHHMGQYGVDNDLRMTGGCETSGYDAFSYGVADRGASVRIPRATHANGCGYYEDRRPGSNVDPYVVTRLLVETTLLMMNLG